MQRLVGGNPILLVGNKADILPKSLKRERLIQWMKREAKELGLKPVDVFLVSAGRGQGSKKSLMQLSITATAKTSMLSGVPM